MWEGGYSHGEVGGMREGGYSLLEVQYGGGWILTW